MTAAPQIEEFSYHYSNDYWDAMLPINGSHESTFLRMGFEFGSFEDGDLLREAKLPSGWRKVSVRDGWHHILDENDKIRAKSFESSKKAFMHPQRRFNHGTEHTNTQAKFVVWDDDGDKRREVFSARFIVPNRARHQEIHKQKVQQYSEQEHCEKWLDKHLPKWRDCCMYWGEEFDFSKMK